jgi:hypothetical protein
MSPQTIRILIAGALFVHGVGHTLGIWKPCRSLPFLKISESTLRLIGGIVWILIAAGFVGASLSFYDLLLPTDWWQPLAVIFAITSLIALVLLGRSWPRFNFIAACAMNIAILIAVFWLL